MALDQKKFLDYNGLSYLLTKFADYPTNEILAVVINAIDGEISDTNARIDELEKAISGTDIINLEEGEY